MIELKQIVISRIKDVKYLRSKLIQNQLSIEQKYQQLAKLKQIEKIRTNKEQQLIKLSDQLLYKTPKHLQNLFEISVQIFTIYDEKYRKYNNRLISSTKDSFKDLYAEFFSQYGFKSKLNKINKILDYDEHTANLSPIYYLLIQWSKTIFSQIIHNSMKIQYQKKNNLQRQALNIKKSSSINFNQIKNRYYTYSAVKIKLPDLPPAEIFVNNKQNVYSYFIEDLYAYYKSFSYLNLDFTLIKNIKKQGKKQDILHKQNINKVIQILISSNNINMQIKNSISNYQRSYNKKFIRNLKKLKPQKFDYSLPSSPQRLNGVSIKKINQKLINMQKIIQKKIYQGDLLSEEKKIPTLKKQKIAKDFKVKKYTMQFPYKKNNFQGSLFEISPSIISSFNCQKPVSYTNGQPELTGGLKNYRSKKYSTQQSIIPIDKQAQQFNQDNFRGQLKKALGNYIKKQETKFTSKNFTIKQLQMKKDQYTIRN